MPFQHETLAKNIADRLNVLADQLKTRTRARFTDANQSLEFVMARFFNALLGWNLVNLNDEQANFPAADLGDRALRTAMQITNEDASRKIASTTATAIEHRLGGQFDRLIIFFLLSEKPSMPRHFVQPADGPAIETWDLADLLKRMMTLEVSALTAALSALEEEMGDPVTLRYTHLHQLPPRPAGFVGREGDLAELRALDPASGALLTGLKGMGGIGKTALALVLAHEWAARFPDAQLFLDARGTQQDAPSAGDLLARVIQTFHPTAKLPEDEAALRGIYHDVLGGKKVLILLDNARGTQQAAPLILPEGCALIVTSRHSFMLGTTRPHDVGRLPDDKAAELLREYHGALTDAETADIVKFCAGLPLALRLAGSRLSLDGDVAAYVKALRSGPLAALDPEAADAGEATITETLRLSEAPLPEAERAAWRALGVFTAAFDARAAQAIAGADATMLRHFLRRSLLEREGAERYKVHDLAADYARARLDADALTALHLAHAGHYTAVGYEATDLYLKGNAMGGLALFDRERAQIESAYSWLAAREDETAARQMIALVNAVVHTGQQLRFHPRLRIAWLERQLRAARLVKHRVAEGTAVCNLGLAHSDLGDARKAIDFHKRALVVSREIGDRRGEGNNLGNLGNAHDDLGDTRRAIDFYERALVVSCKIGDRRGEGNALGNLGNAHFSLGDARKAIEYHEQHQVIVREIGDRHGEGGNLGNLGIAQFALGDARKAIDFHEQALVIDREIGDRRGEANALFNSALQLEKLGQRGEARVRAEQAAEIFAAIESPHAGMVREFAERLRGEV